MQNCATTSVCVCSVSRLSCGKCADDTCKGWRAAAGAYLSQCFMQHIVNRNGDQMCMTFVAWLGRKTLSSACLCINTSAENCVRTFSGNVFGRKGGRVDFVWVIRRWLLTANVLSGGTFVRVEYFEYYFKLGEFGARPHLEMYSQVETIRTSLFIVRFLQ